MDIGKGRAALECYRKLQEIRDWVRDTVTATFVYSHSDSVYVDTIEFIFH